MDAFMTVIIADNSRVTLNTRRPEEELRAIFRTPSPPPEPLLDEFGDLALINRADAISWHRQTQRRTAAVKEVTKAVIQLLQHETGTEDFFIGALAVSVKAATLHPATNQLTVFGNDWSNYPFEAIRNWYSEHSDSLTNDTSGASTTVTARNAVADPYPPVASARKDFTLSEASIEILRQGMKQRRRDGYSSTLTAAFEAMARDNEKPFGKALAEIVENMIMTVGGAIRDGRWKGEIGSGSRFSSPMGEEFRVRFPLPYDWLPPFIASVYHDLKTALQAGFKLQGKWGRLEYDPADDVMRIVERDAPTAAMVGVSTA